MEKTAGALRSPHKRAEETLYREGLAGEQHLSAEQARHQTHNEDGCE
jgi:hypothetical protein